MKIERTAAVLGAIYLAIAGVWLFFPDALILRVIPGWSAGTARNPLDFLLLGSVAVIFVAGYAITQKALRQESLQRQSAENEYRIQRAYVSTLSQLATHMNSRSDVITVLEFICKEVSSILGVEATTILVYSDQRGTLELAAMYGLPEEFRQLFLPTQITGHALELARVDKPIVISAEDPRFDNFTGSDLYRRHGVQKMAFMPLSHRGEFLGLLAALALNDEVEFTTSQLSLLKTISDQACLALRSDRLFNGIRESTRKLEALRTGDLAILSSLDLTLTLKIFLQQVVSELHADAADVLLVDHGAQILEYAAGHGFTTGKIKESRQRIGEGVAGMIALERRSIYLTELEISQRFVRTDLIENENFTTYYGLPLVAKGELKGVLEVFHRSAFRPTDQWLSFLETLAGQAAIAIDNASMFSNLRQTHSELMMAYDRTLEGWSHALDLRDRESEGHSQRVTDLTLNLAREMKVPEEMLPHIRRGAILHDIGKMGIPDQILSKPAELTVEETQIMEKHPTYAMEMLAPIHYLNPAMDIPYCHHEKWDGSGYPRGLKGEVIPLPARIFAVVDVWDALTSDRPYRKAMTKEEATRYLRDQAGKHFDRKVVETFLTTQE